MPRCNRCVPAAAAHASAGATLAQCATCHRLLAVLEHTQQLPSLKPCPRTQMMLCNASWPLLVFQDANFTSADVGWLSLRGARCGCICCASQPFSGFCGAMVCFQTSMPCRVMASNHPAQCEAPLLAAAPQTLWSGPPPSHHCFLMLPTAPSHCKWTFSRPTSASRSACTARCATVGSARCSVARRFSLCLTLPCTADCAALEPPAACPASPQTWPLLRDGQTAGMLVSSTSFASQEDALEGKLTRHNAGLNA